MIFKRIFFWLSGAGTHTLEQCPNWEQRKYVAFGATVLVPCLFAFIACSYAVSTLTGNPWVIYPIALVWSFIILAIDRALLASYRPYLHWHRKIGQFGLRFLVALLLGITISHPLTLMLFRDSIRSEIEKDRAEEVEAARDRGAAQQERLEKRIAAVEGAIADQRQKMTASYDVTFLEPPLDNAAERATAKFSAGKAASDELKKRIDQAQKPILQKIAVNAKLIEQLSPQLGTVQTELDFWQKEFEREINGQRSGIVGVGPRARSVESDQIAWRRAEVQRLSGEVEHLVAENQRLQSEVAAAESALIAEYEAIQLTETARVQEQLVEQRELRRSIEASQAEKFVEQQDVVREGIHRQIGLRTEELERLQSDLAALVAENRESLEILRTEPRNDLLTQTLALHALFERGEEGGQFALTAYLLLIGLFLLVDTIPLVVKFFSKPGPYDTLVDRDEVRFEKDHLAYISNYERYMERATAQGLASLTRDQPLEEALIAGIERSRAAKVFIESLIELEQAFQKRMSEERAALALQADEATIARRMEVLESMAANFQVDMKQRMEQFFQHERTGPRAQV